MATNDDQTDAIMSKILASKPNAADTTSTTAADSAPQQQQQQHAATNSGMYNGKANLSMTEVQMEGKETRTITVESDAATKIEHRSPFSMEEEEMVLDAILAALEDQVSSVSTSLGVETAAETDDVTEVIDNAIRRVQGERDSSAKERILALRPMSQMDKELKAARMNGGWLNAFTVRPPGLDTKLFYAVGSTLGLVFLMDQKCKIFTVLGNQRSDHPRGSAMSIDISGDGQMIIVGHERGVVALWDTNTATQQKLLTGEFHNAVTYVRFVPNNRFVAVEERTGVAKVFTIVSKILGNLVTRSQEVMQMQTRVTGFDITDFIRPPSRPEDSSDYACFFAASTAANVVVGLIRVSHVNNTHTILGSRAAPQPVDEEKDGQQDDGEGSPKGGADKTSPAMKETTKLCWVGAEEDPSKRTLVACCKDVVQVYNMFVTIMSSGGSNHDDEIDASLIPSHTISIEGSIPAMLCMTWVANHCVISIDSLGNGHLVDIAHAKHVETLCVLPGSQPDDPHMRVYAKADDGVLYCANHTKMTALSTLTWEERLRKLTAGKRWWDALELVKEFTMDTAIAVIGLSGDIRGRTDDLTAHVVALWTSYIAEQNKAIGADDMKGRRNLIRKMVDYCIQVDQLNLLFGPLFGVIVHCNLKDLFVFCLMDCLQRQNIPEVPEFFIVAMIDMFLKDGTYKQFLLDEELPNWETEEQTHDTLEYSLMHIQGCDSVLRDIAAVHHLSRLLCTFCLVRTHEFVVPLQTLITDDAAIFLDYVSSTFQEKTFVPSMTVENPVWLKAKSAIVDELFSDAGIEEYVGPLLIGDHCGDFLEALRCILFDTSKSTPWAFRPTKDRDDIIYGVRQILFEGNPQSALHPWQLHQKVGSQRFEVLRTFALLSMDAIMNNMEQSVVLDETHTMQLILLACYEVPTGKRLEVQAAVCNLIYLILDEKRIAYSEDGFVAPLLNEMLKAKMARICAVLYGARGEFFEAIETFLNTDYATTDPTLPTAVFDFLRHHIVVDERREYVQEAIHEFFQPLVSTQATEFAKFVIDHMPSNHDQILDSLESSPDAQYLYLKGVLARNSYMPELQARYVHLLCDHDPDAVYKYLTDNEKELVDYDIEGLLAKCRAKNIVDAAVYLLERTDQSHEAVKLALQTITENIVRVREEVLGVLKGKSAEDLYKDSISFGAPAVESPGSAPTSPSNAGGGGQVPNTSNISHQSDAHVTSVDGISVSLRYGAEDALFRMVKVGTEVCSRSKKRVNATEFTAVWFMLLDRFIVPKKVLTDRLGWSKELEEERGSPRTPTAYVAGEEKEVNELDAGKKKKPLKEPMSPFLTRLHQEMVTLYSKYTTFILRCMMRVVPLDIVLMKIIEDHEQERCSHFKPILNDILTSLTSDLALCRLGKMCTDSDIFRMGQAMTKILKGGLRPASETCMECGRHLAMKVTGLECKIRYYPCGHGYHDRCCADAPECPRCTAEKLFGPAAVQNMATLSKENIGSSSSSGFAPKEQKHSIGEEKDIPFIVRRLKKTRLRLDGGVNTYELMLHYTGVAEATGSLVKSTARTLLLTPAPRLNDSMRPTARSAALPTVPAVSASVPHTKAVAMFGSKGLFVPRPPPPPRKKKIVANADDGDDDDIDLAW